MQMKPIISHLDSEKMQRLGEVVRFGIVGVVATLLQYGTYLLMLRWVNAGIANTVGYALSFLFNFFASTHFTFRVRPNARRGAGFALSHVINYCLQMLLLWLFIKVGVSKPLAPIPMFAICVPINFLLVRFFLKR